MNTFSCPCGGKFKNTSRLVYLSYPPKYLFKCDSCGDTKVLSEAEAFGNSRKDYENNSLLEKVLKDYNHGKFPMEILEETL